MPGEAGNGNGDGNGAASEVQQQLTDLQGKMTAMEAETETLKGAKADLEQRLDEADKELLGDEYLDFKEKRGKAPAGTGAGDGEGIDLDHASNREIVALIEGKYKGDITAAMKDIKSQLDLSKQQIGMMAAQFDVALTSLRHDGKAEEPSFTANQKEIFEIAKANPKWGAEQCYQQFCLQSKATADKKVVADKKKADEEEKAATERAGVPGSVVQGKQLTKEEAADIAYRKAFGNKE